MLAKFKDYKKSLIWIGIILLMILSIGFWLFNKMNVQLHDLNGRGVFIDSVQSPNKQFVATAYLINDGGPTVAGQVRVSITSTVNDTSDTIFHDETVYWEYRAYEATLKWTDETHLSIQGAKINTIIDIYDKRTYFNWKDYL